MVIVSEMMRQREGWWQHVVIVSEMMRLRRRRRRRLREFPKLSKTKKTKWRKKSKKKPNCQKLQKKKKGGGMKNDEIFVFVVIVTLWSKIEKNKADRHKSRALTLAYCDTCLP